MPLPRPCKPAPIPSFPRIPLHVAAGSLAQRFPLATSVLKKTAHLFDRAVRFVVPLAANVTATIVTDTYSVAAPVVTSVGHAGLDVTRSVAGGALHATRDVAQTAAAGSKSVVLGTLRRHPKKIAAVAGAAIAYQALRDYNEEPRNATRGWMHREKVVCPDGMQPVSVVGAVRSQCAKVPVCSGDNSLGNCPDYSEAFPHRSRCRLVADNTYGCVMQGLDVPVEEVMEQGTGA